MSNTNMLRGDSEYYATISEKALISRERKRARKLKKWLAVGLPALAAKRKVLRRDWPKGLKCHYKEMLPCQTTTSGSMPG